MRVAAQLAHAIHTMHRLGFLHRDISCSNVLLDASNHCRLIDFGVSVVGLTGANRAGSLAYMAPEVNCWWGRHLETKVGTLASPFSFAPLAGGWPCVLCEPQRSA